METPEFKVICRIKVRLLYERKENPFVTSCPCHWNHVLCRSLNRNGHECDLSHPDQAVRNLHRYGAVGHDHLSLSYLHYGAFFQLFIEKLFDSKIVYHRKSLFHYWINDRFVVTFLQYFVDWTLIARDQYRNCVTFDVPYYLKFHPYA